MRKVDMEQEREALEKLLQLQIENCGMAGSPAEGTRRSAARTTAFEFSEVIIEGILLGLGCRSMYATGRWSDAECVMSSQIADIVRKVVVEQKSIEVEELREKLLQMEGTIAIGPYEMRTE